MTLEDGEIHIESVLSLDRLAFQLAGLSEEMLEDFVERLWHYKREGDADDNSGGDRESEGSDEGS